MDPLHLLNPLDQECLAILRSRLVHQDQLLLEVQAYPSPHLDRVPRSVRLNPPDPRIL